MPPSWSPCVALVLLLSLVTLTSVPAASSGGHSGDGEDLEARAQPQLLMMERFHGWMAKHGRRYDTAEEKLRRFEIYRSNVEFIEAANRDGRLSYTLGENLFTDLTHEEFLATYTSSGRPSPPDLEEAAGEEEEEEMVITTRAGHVSEQAFQRKDVPDRVNWTAQGKVTKVKNQGKICGACWAFAAVAAIESAYAIKKDKEPPVLSEQELIDCDRFDSGCRGGWPDEAMNWVKRNGIVLESQYPYVDTCDNKTHVCQQNKLEPRAVSIRDYGYVKTTEEQLMAAVARQPVAVAFDSTDQCFKHYFYGVYDGKCIYPSGEYVGPCSNNKLHHALTIVGYVGKGDDKDKYWIAKNSWGTEWGQQGYVWLKKDVANPKGLCGLVNHKPSYPVV